MTFIKHFFVKNIDKNYKSCHCVVTTQYELIAIFSFLMKIANKTFLDRMGESSPLAISVSPTTPPPHLPYSE